MYIRPNWRDLQKNPGKLDLPHWWRITLHLAKRYNKRVGFFPSNVIAEQTWMKMFETQLEIWTKVPLVTNSQPDFSHVGNADLLDRTIRTHNRIRTDTIFIENTQIEALSNRPPWTAAVCEVGMTTGDQQRVVLGMNADGSLTLARNVRG
jgi:hypothetical protein